MLGYRAIRIYADARPLFRASCARSSRAAAFGRVELMLPIVSSVDEVRWVRHVLAEGSGTRSRARRDAGWPSASMLEVPSAAFALDHLAPSARLLQRRHATTSLQYLRRGGPRQPRTSPTDEPVRPGVPRLLRTIVDGAHATAGGSASAARWRATAAACRSLLGLGFDEVSVSSPHIARVKAAVRRLSAAACRTLLETRSHAPRPPRCARSSTRPTATAGPARARPRDRRSGRPHEGRGDQARRRRALRAGTDGTAARDRGGALAARDDVFDRARPRLRDPALPLARRARRLARWC